MALLLFLVTLAAGASCPPPAAFDDTVKNLDLGKYIAAEWYTQAQVTVDFQRPDSFFCVRARYVAVDSSDLKKGLDVINYGNLGRVNGQAVGVSGAAGNTSFALFAVPAPTTGPSANSKLLVGPKQFVSRAPAQAVAAALKAPNGNYRIVAVGPSADERLGYEWAIIIGGATAPSEPTDKGCAPSEAKNEGLWLFHRKPVAPAADVALMKKTAQELGIDTSRLMPVQQEGCKYEGADPAPTTTTTATTTTAAAPAAASSSGAAAQQAAPQAKAAAATPVVVAVHCSHPWLKWLFGHLC